MIYLDNSATTLIKPKEVIKAVNDSLLYYSANPGRSGHKASVKTALKIEEVREVIARHFNVSSAQNTVFTTNCTHALNIAILGSAKQGGHIVCTENEHNSVLRPLELLKNLGIIDYTIAYQSTPTGITVEDIKKCINENTYMIICNHISNVNGDMADIKTIGKNLKEKGITFLVDGAQSGGHFRYDMKEMNIDMLVFSPHKGFYSPQGVGCLIKREYVQLEPILFGGTGTNSLELVQPEGCPERFESGTLNTPAILGFGAGIDFVEENFDIIKEKMEDLTTYLHYELSKMPIEIYTATENTHGVFAFNIPHIHSDELANFLNDRFEICVRSGYHCAPKKHEALGTLNSGCVRVSFGITNTFQEVEKLINIIKHLLKTNKLNK